MSIKLTRKQITVRLRKGELLTMAWTYNSLAAHKEVISKKHWVITHIPTGYAILPYPGKYKMLRQFIKEVYSLLEWDALNRQDIINELYGKERMKDKLLEIYERYKDEN